MARVDFCHFTVYEHFGLDLPHLLTIRISTQKLFPNSAFCRYWHADSEEITTFESRIWILCQMSIILETAAEIILQHTFSGISALKQDSRNKKFYGLFMNSFHIEVGRSRSMWNIFLFKVKTAPTKGIFRPQPTPQFLLKPTYHRSNGVAKSRNVSLTS